MLCNIKNSLLLILFIVKNIGRQKNEKKWVPNQIRFSDITHQKLLKKGPRQEVRQEVASFPIKDYKEFSDFSYFPIFFTSDQHVKNLGYVPIKISSS